MNSSQYWIHCRILFLLLLDSIGFEWKTDDALCFVSWKMRDSSCMHMENGDLSIILQYLCSYPVEKCGKWICFFVYSMESRSLHELNTVVYCTLRMQFFNHWKKGFSSFIENGSSSLFRDLSAESMVYWFTRSQHFTTDSYYLNFVWHSEFIRISPDCSNKFHGYVQPKINASSIFGAVKIAQGMDCSVLSLENQVNLHLWINHQLTDIN